jgi:hypothetical protein
MNVGLFAGSFLMVVAAPHPHADAFGRRDFSSSWPARALPVSGVHCLCSVCCSLLEHVIIDLLYPESQEEMLNSLPSSSFSDSAHVCVLMGVLLAVKLACSSTGLPSEEGCQVDVPTVLLALPGRPCLSQRGWSWSASSPKSSLLLGDLHN